MADCGIPVRANPSLTNDAQRWEVLLNKVAAPLVDDIHGPEGAAALLLRGYRPETQRGYMSKVRAFLKYCQQHDRAPLPTSVPSIIG